MTFESALAAAQMRPDDEDALAVLARSALAEGREDLALPILRKGTGPTRKALLWQWTGLLERALDEHECALQSFATAAALAPGDPSIAHGRARVALEAGLPAADLFRGAMQLSPTDPALLLGYVASLFAEGRAAAAEEVLDEALERVPLWIEGHVQLAQLRSMLGKKERSGASLERAIRSQPRIEPLWIALFRLLVQSQSFSELDDAVHRARPYLQPGLELLRYEAIAAAETQQTDRADRLFAAMTLELKQSSVIWLIRHLLRGGRLLEACRTIEAALATDMAANVWPYASIAWRLAGDPRCEWLESELDRVVSVIDLSATISRIPSLETVLRKLHSGKGEFLDQSVRGGSQTDGPLFTRIEPEIRALREAISSAVEHYVHELPDADAAHPLLGLPRDCRTRFSGSWSVFLRSGGYHANHVHPEGWISSALYIHLPERSARDTQMAGWLSLGQPDPKIGVDLEPSLNIEPKVGRLVLFPSYMWHGTRPFCEGERLTVAFDVARPNVP